MATGKAFLAFRHLPLIRIHKRAVSAAQAAECANREGRFWEMHDQLFAAPDQLASDAIQAHAGALGLSRSWTECFGAPSNSQVAADLKEAERLKIGSTPGFLIGRMEGPDSFKILAFIDGAREIAEFSRALDNVASTR